jgi:hypothetical protein
LVLAHLQRRWNLSDREGFTVPLSRRDSAFVETKCLFFIAPNDEIGGEVTEVFLAEKQASDTGFGGVRHDHRVCCITLAALCRCVSTRHGGGQVTDTWRQHLVMERQTRPMIKHENGPLWSASVAPSDARAHGVKRVCRVVLKRSIILVTVGVQRCLFNRGHVAAIERSKLRSDRRWPRLMIRCRTRLVLLKNTQ